MLTKEINFENLISWIFTVLSFLYRTLLYSKRTSLIVLLFAYLLIFCGLNTAQTRETTSHSHFPKKTLFVISIVLFIVIIWHITDFSYLGVDGVSCHFLLHDNV